MTLDLITDFYKEALTVIVVGKKKGTVFPAGVSDAWRVVRFFKNTCGLWTTLILNFQNCRGKYSLKVWEKFPPLILFLSSFSYLGFSINNKVIILAQLVFFLKTESYIYFQCMYTCCFSEDIYNVQIFRGNWQHYNRSQLLLYFPRNALITSVMYDKALVIFLTLQIMVNSNLVFK